MATLTILDVFGVIRALLLVLLVHSSVSNFFLC